MNIPSSQSSVIIARINVCFVAGSFIVMSIKAAAAVLAHAEVVTAVVGRRIAGHSSTTS